MLLPYWARNVRFCRRIVGLVLFILLLLLLATSHVSIFRRRPVPAYLTVLNSSTRLELNEEKKTILFWTEYFGTKDFEFGFGSSPFDGCPVTCRTTNDRNLLGRSDAIIFHPTDLWDFPVQRWPHQRWIFYNNESPDLTPDIFRGLVDVFNWTMSYRTDSDVYAPYGIVTETAVISDVLRDLVSKHLIDLKPISRRASDDVIQHNRTMETWSQFVRRKRKKVAWFVSHCRTSSEREVYVAQLQKFIDVDVYGRCGDHQCGDELKRQPECYDLLERDYKFYLAFENALCPDYLTEKFFNALKYNVVPVVYGGANYAQLAPQNSYIDIRDFKSARHLADYLNYLDGNEEEYLRYFEWRQAESPDVPALPEWRNFFQPYCTLCQMLHQDRPPRSYPDIHSWWFDLGQCGVGERGKIVPP